MLCTLIRSTVFSKHVPFLLIFVLRYSKTPVYSNLNTYNTLLTGRQVSYTASVKFFDKF